MNMAQKEARALIPKPLFYEPELYKNNILWKIMEKF